ncbi:hypothetical protein GCM10009796_13560 [Microbacterium koreense]
MTGALAAAVGTLAMDLVWFRRYRAGGGQERFAEWEFADDVKTWADASAPGQVGLKLERAVLREDPPDALARPTTNAMHWMTGIGWGAAYGVAARLFPRVQGAAAALGPVAWLTSYAILPVLGVYKPMWKYDRKTLGKDFSAHMVFGLVTAAAFSILSRGLPGLRDLVPGVASRRR